MDITEFDKEICEELRKQIPVLKDNTDEDILKYNSHVPKIYELVGNKGYTTEEAIALVSKI